LRLKGGCARADIQHEGAVRSPAPPSTISMTWTGHVTFSDFIFWLTDLKFVVFKTRDEGNNRELVYASKRGDNVKGGVHRTVLFKCNFE
jgi:hypothetical protein